jgi:hypothetical protein
LGPGGQRVGIIAAALADSSITRSLKVRKETMSRPTSKVAEVRVPGPLAPFVDAFRAALSAAGYTPLSAVVQLRLMVHLSRWLDGRGLSAADLTAPWTRSLML